MASIELPDTSTLRGLPHSKSCPTLFFDLPQELRDMVYDELWKVAPRLQVARGRINRGTFEVHYGTMTTFSVLQYGLPRWLLCNKRFLDEGICQLISKGAWTCRWFPPVLPSRPKHSQLIDLQHVTNLTFIVNMINDATGEGMKIVLPPVRSQTSLAISGLSPKIKNLTLQAYHDQLVDGMLMRVTASTPWAIDLSWLDTSTLQLDSITVRGTMWGCVDLQPIAGGFQDAYQAELTRLGSLLVGQDGQVETEKVFTRSNEGRFVPPTHAYCLGFVVRFWKTPT